MNTRLSAWFFRLTFACACLLGWGGTAAAGTVSFAGTVTSADQALTDCVTNYANVRAFTVSATGTYTLTNNQAPAAFNGPTFYYAAVFTSAPTFASGNPDRLFVINNTAVGATATSTLNAGTTYYLVVGGSTGCGTVYPVAYDFTLSSPAGTAVLAPLSVTQVPSLGHFSIALLAAMLAWTGLRRKVGESA